VEGNNEEQVQDDAQKRRLRAVRRGYRADKVAIKDNGWQLEVEYLDGTKITVNSKLLKLKAEMLQQTE
jgi:hypothetical protein